MYLKCTTSHGTKWLSLWCILSSHRHPRSWMLVMLLSTVNKYENKRKDREQQKKNKLVFSLICFKRENVKLICFVYAFASRKKKKEQKKPNLKFLLRICWFAIFPNRKKIHRWNVQFLRSSLNFFFSSACKSIPLERNVKTQSRENRAVYAPYSSNFHKNKRAYNWCVAWHSSAWNK